MEDSKKWNRVEPDRSRSCREMKDSCVQTDSKIQGPGPRLSKVNLFTLLSLWMELFPQEQLEEDDSSQIHGMGLVVVREGKVVGLHCSGSDLHAGQAAIIQHGANLADCQLYFSRRPCATCLKMIINGQVRPTSSMESRKQFGAEPAILTSLGPFLSLTVLPRLNRSLHRTLQMPPQAGVSQISFWPGDPEISMFTSASKNQTNSHSPPDAITEEAALDAMATEKLKSNSRPHICVQLQPLAPGLGQFVYETSRECDFMERLTEDDPGLNIEELFNRERVKHLGHFTRQFLVGTSHQHKHILIQMGLENFCVEPYFSNLRHNMRELVEVLAAVAAGVPQQNSGFYREQLEASVPPHHGEVSQDVARHCIIQARLLAYRTEDPKVGVGVVIWAKGKSVGCSGTGRLYLVGCGYNAYPTGSKHAEYPQMDNKQEDRQRRKYRYIIHAEQNALTFRMRDIKPEEPAMLFVTKCPCDECVPLIRGAGITHIYTSDQDRDKDKGDISYLRFSLLKDINKFIWQRSPSASSVPPRLANGCVGKHSRETELDSYRNKKLCSKRCSNSSSVHVDG